VRLPLTIPSSGLGARKDRVPLLALLSFRNESRYLPGFLRNVAGQVDGIIALDDGSTDGSADLLEAGHGVLEVLRNPPERPCWDEPGNFRKLVEAAHSRGPGWILSVDADERLERDFRLRAERVIRRGEWLGLSAYAIRLRELWDTPHQYRADGIWGRKAVPRLFRSRKDHRFDERPLHASKAPLQGRAFGRYPIADLFIYHMRMIGARDREARRLRYQEADPEARWQPGLGYDYLTDETGLVVRTVPDRRGYEE